MENDIKYSGIKNNIVKLDILPTKIIQKFNYQLQVLTILYMI